MSDLLNDIYLPEFKKKNIQNSNSYRLLKEAGEDPTIIEGYENDGNNRLDFPVFNTQADRDKFAEEQAQSTASSAKEYLETFGNFLTEETDDLVTTLSLAAVNGADVATNLIPLTHKMMANTSLGMAMPPEFFSPKTEEEIMKVSQHWSENLGEYRNELLEKQKDNGWVKDILSYVIQDSAYSIPAYNFLRKAGMPKYPAFFLSAGVGAIGVQDKDADGEKTYFDFFAKDVVKLKELAGILPNTPEDKIADEVVQALEYGSFGTILPGIIDGFKFMKRYIPYFAGATGAGIGIAPQDAEGSPFKSILKAVDNAPMFKSAVVDAAEKLPNTGTGEQIYNTIKNTPGVKQSELKWLDLDNYFKKEAKTKFNKQQIIDLINNNKVDVSEVQFSKSAPVELPRRFQQAIDDYEARWRDSDLADEARPNYDRFNLRVKNYVVPEVDGSMIDRNVPQDWQTLYRNDFINAMDISSEMIGAGRNWENVQATLKLNDWLDQSTNKYTGHLIELDQKGIKEFAQDDYNFVTSIGTPGSDEYVERYIVTSKDLNVIPKNYKGLATYEIDPLELERFHLEDNIRNFKLGDSAKSNQPVYGRYTVPGGEDYTELVFKIRTKDQTTPAILEGEFGTLANNKVKSAQKTSIDFRGPHFNRPNEFAHVRFKTRTLDNGKKVLTVEEMQSDLLQASKTEMFMSSYAPGGVADKVLKDFPFKNNWYEFTIKRLARYAADNGFDAIAIPKGSLAANRYGQRINKLEGIEVQPFETNEDILADIRSGGEFVNRSEEPGFVIKLTDKNGDAFLEKTVVGLPGDQGFFEEMARVLRKQVSDKTYPIIQEMIQQSTDTGGDVFKKLDKSEIVGSGAGKFRLYDETIPAFMKKYGKKWNAKIYDEKIPYEDLNVDSEFKPDRMKEMPVTVLELSDEMKKDVVSSSQPLFEIFGTVSLSAWGAKEVSDSIENNIISQTTENMY